MPECSAASVGPRLQKHGHQEDVWETSPRYASSAVLEALEKQGWTWELRDVFFGSFAGVSGHIVSGCLWV